MMAWSNHITIFKREQGSVSSVSQVHHSESTTDLICCNTLAETTTQDFTLNFILLDKMTFHPNYYDLNQHQNNINLPEFTPELYNQRKIQKKLHITKFHQTSLDLTRPHQTLTCILKTGCCTFQNESILSVPLLT